MFKYFLFFLAMLMGAGVGIYIGLLIACRRNNSESPCSDDKNEAEQTEASAEPIRHERIEKTEEKVSAEEATDTTPQQSGLLSSKIGEYVATEADPDEAEEILEKMRKQDQFYCTLRQDP